MTEQNGYSPFEKEVRTALAVPAAQPEFVEGLQAALLQQKAQKPARPRRPFYLQPGWAAPLVIVTLLLVVTLLVGPQRVLAAVRGLFGYIPGVGVVQEGETLRVLAETATAEREGIALEVQQGAADSQRTILVYQADGLSVAASNSQGEGAPTGGLAMLVLPDGSLLTQIGGEMRGWGTGYQTRLVFPPLPGDVNEFTLLIQRLETMPPGAAPEDWQIPLRFEPAPADFEMLPVYEVTQSTDETVSPTAVVSMPSSEVTEGSNGIQLVLDRVVELEEGFQMQGYLTWEGQPYGSVMFDPWLKDTVTLTDGQGNAIPFESSQPDYSLAQGSETSSLWALQTNSKAYPGPWTLTVNSMAVYQAVNDPAAGFLIDFGAAPQAGQTWELDQAVQAAGFSLRAVSASLRLDDRMGNPVVDMIVETDPAVISFSLEDPLNQPEEGQMAGAGGGPQEMQSDQRITMIPYFEMPAGQRTLQVTSVSYNLADTWEVSWNPPAVSEEMTAPQPEAACLTDETWAAAADAALPEGLEGRLLVETYTGELMPQLSLWALDGGSQQVLGLGGWSSLSPDGTTAAYIESDGPALMLMDVTSGQVTALPGSTPEDYSPVWSPDGQWLAFVRSNAGIYVSRTDGSEMRQVADAARVRFLFAWLPDGQGLVIASLTSEGSQVQKLDLASETTEDLFPIENVKGGFALPSPDGKRVIFHEMGFGMTSYGLYMSNMDGSEKRLLASVEDGGFAATAWSPDGEWLMLVHTAFENQKPVETPLLLQPDTCQIIPLAYIEGNVTSWVP